MVNKEQYAALHRAIRQKWEERKSVESAFTSLRSEFAFSFSRRTIERDYRKFKDERMDTSEIGETIDNQDSDSDDEDTSDDSDESDDSDDDQQVKFNKQLKQTKRMCVLLRLQATNNTATNADIFQSLNDTFGNNFVTKSFVQFWASKFRNGQMTTSSQPRPGQKILVSETDFLEYTQSHPDATTEQMSSHFGVSKGCIRKRLKKLGYKSRIRQWIPQELNEQQMATRVRICQERLVQIRRQRSFFDNLITMDEKYVMYENPFKQRYWYHPDRPVVVQEPQRRQFCSKVHLVVFWDQFGILHYSLEPERSRLNSTRFCEILQEVSNSIREKRPHLASDQSKVLLLMDNARCHTSRETTEKINQLKWQVLEHPPHSPDLAPSDFFLFLSLSQALKGKTFNDVIEVEMFLEDYFQEKDNQGDFWRR